ncbi:23399_t:CDS:2, partial [Gigaspora rosea]
RTIRDESCGWVNYAVKESEELICITEDKVQQKLTEGFTQNIKQLESEILQASKAPFSIEFTEEALVENSKEYQTLRKGVKKEDRACVEDKSERKKARIEKYHSKNSH